MLQGGESTQRSSQETKTEVTAANFRKTIESLNLSADTFWLENIFAIEGAGKRKIQYIFCARDFKKYEVIVVDLGNADADISPLPSLRDKFLGAAPFEEEISEMFGIQFEGQTLNDRWSGFPLKKSFRISQITKELP